MHSVGVTSSVLQMVDCFECGDELSFTEIFEYLRTCSLPKEILVINQLDAQNLVL